jgi:hypothetical protein
MLTLPTAALLLAAAPLTDAPARFDHAKLIEGQKALIASYAQTREVVSGVYHWATHNVMLDRYLAQQMALDAARSVEATERAFANLTGQLSPAEAEKVARETTAARDLLAKASRLAGELRSEAGRDLPRRTEVRAITGELYEAMALGANFQNAIGTRLGIEHETAGTQRVR